MFVMTIQVTPPRENCPGLMQSPAVHRLAAVAWGGDGTATTRHFTEGLLLIGRTDPLFDPSPNRGNGMLCHYFDGRLRLGDNDEVGL